MKKHRNIIELLGFVEEKDCFAVVLELANQTLLNFVKQRMRRANIVLMLIKRFYRLPVVSVTILKLHFFQLRCSICGRCCQSYDKSVRRWQVFKKNHILYARNCKLIFAGIFGRAVVGA